MASTDTTSLVAEFTDILSAELLLAPDPELVFAKHAYAAAMAAEMKAANEDEFSLVDAQIKALTSAQSGVAANMAASMAQGGEGSLLLSMGMNFPDLVYMVKEAKEAGDTIKLNRPQYLPDVIGAGRVLKPTSTMFGSSQPLGMDQVPVTLVETSGPGDASGNTVPVGINLFTQERARHDMLENAKLQLRRSRHRWVHYNIQNPLLASTNITRPAGVSSGSDFTGAGNEPLAYELLARVEAKLQKRNIPGIGGQAKYPFYVTPDGLAQLKTDPAYQRQAEFHEGYNLLFPGYVRTVGNLVICVVNTFPGTTGGSGGSVPVLQAMAVAPRAVGWALGSDARLLRDKNDDGGRFLRAGWRAAEGFVLLNSDFVEVVNHT